MERTIGELLADHPFFAGLPAGDLQLIAGCGHNVVLRADEMVFREGDPADRFYVIRHGAIALELFVPERGPLVVDSVSEGGVVGVSWLVPPHQWQFDGRALDVVRAVSIDGVCLRRKCEEDTRLGYELMSRFARLLAARMQSARVRLVDIYGHAGVR